MHGEKPSRNDDVVPEPQVETLENQIVEKKSE
jgi:hypothetical protein